MQLKRASRLGVNNAYEHVYTLASVRRPRTLIFILTFELLRLLTFEPCFFEHARKSDPPRGCAVTPYICI